MNKPNASPNPSDATAIGGDVFPVGTPIEVRGKLALLGWPSVSAWGEAHGYSRTMTTYVVKQWGSTSKRPHGGIARHLMHNLRETLATGRRPEHLQQVEEMKNAA